MILRPCTFQQAPEILAIFNDAILHSTALYDYKARTLANMEAWFEAKTTGNYPVIGAFDEQDNLLGFASYGTFRAWPAYKYTVEHSVYVRQESRGCGLGRRLLEAIIEAAKRQNYHVLVGVIDASNAPSIRLHQRMGFQHGGSVKHAGYKFGRWLDIEFYQLTLPTPATPLEE